MTSKDETSRHWILDAIECIKNCEAIVSHCNEIMDSIYDNVSKNDKAYDDYMNLNRMKEIATKVRRKTMRKIYESFDKADHQYWCILKHAVAAKGFMDEVVAADDGNHPSLRSNEPHDLYELMSLAISSFIGVEPQVCARCMADDLEEKTIELSDETNKEVIDLLDKDLMFQYKGMVDNSGKLPSCIVAPIGSIYITLDTDEVYINTGEWGWKTNDKITKEMREAMSLAIKKQRDEEGHSDESI